MESCSDFDPFQGSSLEYTDCPSGSYPTEIAGLRSSLIFRSDLVGCERFVHGSCESVLWKHLGSISVPLS